MNTHSDEGERVRRFYDQFTRSRMAPYRERGNLRIEKALHRILPYLTADSVVLEIGCGIGIVSEHVSQRVKSLWACDISEEGVATAAQHVRTSNAHFRRIDVVREFEVLKEWIPSRVHLVLLVDVLEHIPKAEQSTLFQNLRSVLADQSTLVVTFPSPAYQDYLAKEKPEELQIVDEKIELPDLLELALSNGLAVKHYSLEDVWLNNQYVHCVLQTTAKILLLDPDREAIASAKRAVESLVPEGCVFIWADQAEWAVNFAAERKAIPFMEKDGEYWGPPENDKTAIDELERLRTEGASFAVFCSPAFWWLDHYSGLRQHLESDSRRIFANERLVVYDLRH